MPTTRFNPPNPSENPSRRQAEASASGGAGGPFFVEPAESCADCSDYDPPMSRDELRRYFSFEKTKAWRKRNADKYAQWNRDYYARTKHINLARSAAWRKENADRKREVDRQYRIRNAEKLRVLKAEGQRRRRRDPLVRLIVAMRARVYDAVTAQRACKGKKTMALVGCSGTDLRKYLESKFRPGMTWGNYGEWVVDHIVPCAAFDLSVVENQQRCFHFSNLQPLWREENSRKSARLDFSL